MQTLTVRFGDELVAELAQERGGLTLAYRAGAKQAVSVRLPVRAEAYSHEQCRHFFASLLPEGSFRTGLCRRLALPPSDDWALLSLMGADCAGALSLLAEGAAGHAAYTPIAEVELRRWLKHAE